LSLRFFVFFDPSNFADTFYAPITDINEDFSVCDIATGREGWKNKT